MNLATSELVNLGEAVGIIAAQSIGEPGTQLTMRTFHTGGVAGDDITQGLPRVEELFEARKPKKMAQISEIDGVVDVDDSHRTALRNITITADDGEVKQYQVPYSVGLKVEHGKRVRKGEPITDGALNPHDVLRISGVEAVQDYLTQGVLAVYRQQGVDINEKHIEVIIRQMMRKVRVEDPGDTTLLSGTVVDVFEFEDANAAVQARIDAGETDLRLATDSLILMGITKASLGNGVLAVRRLLPGDHQGPDRRRHQGQGRPSGRPEGERHHRQAHPRRLRPQGLPRFRHPQHPGIHRDRGNDRRRKAVTPKQNPLPRTAGKGVHYFRLPFQGSWQPQAD